MSKPRPTIAEVCRAIADGNIPAEKQGKYYAVSENAVRRYYQRTDLAKAGPLAVLLAAIPQPQTQKAYAHAQSRKRH